MLFLPIVVYLAAFFFLAMCYEADFATDFSIFYVAAQETLSGHPELVYDISAHSHAIEEIRGTTTILAPYFYPPHSLFMFLPLGLFSSTCALAIWMIFGLALYTAAMYKLFPDKKMLFFAYSCPGILINICWGQNAFITCSLLLGFLYFLRKKPWLAGVLLGLLTYKPQFALFCLIAVVASKNWQCVAASIVTTFLMVIASVKVFGFSTWLAFFELIEKFNEISLIFNWTQFAPVQPTAYSLFRLAGIEQSTALMMQYMLSLVMAVLIYYVWSHNADHNLSVVVLGLGIMLGLTYYIQYDMLIVIIPVLFSMASATPTSQIETFLLRLLWLLPIVSWVIVYITGIQITPIACAALLIITLQKIRKLQVTNQ